MGHVAPSAGCTLSVDLGVSAGVLVDWFDELELATILDNDIVIELLPVRHYWVEEMTGSVN